ncbi:perilipin-1 isoform X1 [Marmota monax]|uniref:Perilipin-1 n=1 Tax=Marmota monax TaxID=9995 RepID=A0A834PW65_MARMO|nr:perilipin-1 isoform X1 [Marmota monax]KAF7466960.1 perilipin-1 [Marmota monax]
MGGKESVFSTGPASTSREAGPQKDLDGIGLDEATTQRWTKTLDRHFDNTCSLPEQENVLQRVMQLPVVSGTCECFQKTYTSTKEAHPLVASVCNAYEKGVQGASNLAAWSMEPVVRRLSTQFIAANELACRGLDHLEEKIPALQYPPEKIASELKDTISTRLRSARNSISVPITSTSDKVLGATLAGYELARGMAKETVEYAANTRAGRLASGGADLALGSIEKVVEYLLPPAKEESASVPGHQGAQKPPKAKPSLVSRMGTLANTLSRHTMQTTAWALKQGHSLAMWIPGVAPLSSLAQWGASMATQVVSRRQSEVRVPWLHNLPAAQDEDHNDQTDTEGEETEEEEESEAEENKLSEEAALPSSRGLLGSVAHTLQKTLQGTISAVTWAPMAVLGTAGRILHLTPAPAVSSTKGRAMSLSDALKGVTDNVVDTVVHYVPLPRLSLMEPESEFRDIDNPPAETEHREAERKGSGAPPTSPEPAAPRLAQHRGSLRSARGPGLEDKIETTSVPRCGFLAMPREKPKRRVSDSFFRPSVMEPILGRTQYSQLRKKS